MHNMFRDFTFLLMKFLVRIPKSNLRILIMPTSPEPTILIDRVQIELVATGFHIIIFDCLCIQPHIVKIARVERISCLFFCLRVTFRLRNSFDGIILSFIFLHKHHSYKNNDRQCNRSACDAALDTILFIFKIFFDFTVHTTFPVLYHPILPVPQ